MNVAIENRKLLIIEDALTQNNYFDCDVVQDYVNKLQSEDNLEQMIYRAIHLKDSIIYRGGNIKNIKTLIDELSSIHIKNLIN